LGGRGANDGHLLARGSSHIANRPAQRLRQIHITRRHKLLRVLRAVNACQVKHNVHPLQLLGQLRHIMVAGEANHLDIIALGEVQLQVLANKTIAAGNQNFLVNLNWGRIELQ
jgi:hypothetical protein